MAYNPTGVRNRYVFPYVMMSLLSPINSLLPTLTISMLMLCDLADATARMARNYSPSKKRPATPAKGGDDDVYYIQKSDGTTFTKRGRDMPGSMKLSPHDDLSRVDYPLQEAQRLLKADSTLAHNPYASVKANRDSEKLCATTMRDLNGVRKICTPEGACFHEVTRIVLCDIVEPGAANTTTSAYADIASSYRTKMIDWGKSGLNVPVQLAKTLFRFFNAAQRCLLANSFTGYQNGYGCRTLLTQLNPNGIDQPRLPYSISNSPHAILFESVTHTSNSGLTADMATVLARAQHPGAGS